MIIKYIRQHTPMIHFQDDQVGATLRPTAVKPALDRYLISKYQPTQEKKIPPEWLVGLGMNEGQTALNYKMQIRGGKAKIHYITEPGNKRSTYPNYFGNMGNEKSGERDKQFVFFPDPLILKIQCFVPELEQFIEKHLSNFFAQTNFMSRQTKGFGSFSVIESDGTVKSPVGQKHFQLNCGDKDIWREFRYLFSDIELFYKSIRSGINMKADRGETDVMYFKSLMFHYAKGKGHQWDKRKMRRDLFIDHPDFRRMERRRTDADNPVNYRNGQPYLYRDMLGLASDTQWQSYRDNVKKEHKANTENSKIARYPSPIIFKPIHVGEGYYDVYLLGRKSGDDEEMRGQTFKVFTAKSGKSTTMKTPGEFDVDQFINFVCDFFKAHDFDDYVGNYKSRGEGEVEILKDIYQQLAR